MHEMISRIRGMLAGERHVLVDDTPVLIISFLVELFFRARARAPRFAKHQILNSATTTHYDSIKAW